MARAWQQPLPEMPAPPPPSAWSRITPPSGYEPQWRRLVDAALVALKPGGVLVLETPNPTNVNVGASSFYLDPTHLKPLHPQFLEFLVSSRGFAETEVRYLNPEDVPALTVDDLAPNGELARSQQLVDRINWALSGPLDYGIVATKAPATGA